MTLLTGVTGQLGNELLPILSEICIVRTVSRKDVDLSDSKSLEPFLKQIGSDGVQAISRERLADWERRH